MREELLAHVAAIFEEEAARLDDEQAALERTAQRFGNPAELTGQLQMSVPRRDFLQRLLEGVAVRFAVLTFIVGAVLFLPALFLQGRMSEQPELFYFPTLVLFYFPTLVFCFLLLVDWMWQALNDNGGMGRFWRRSAIAAVASWFIIPGMTFGLLLTLSGDVRSSLTDVLTLLPVSALAPVVFLLLMVGFRSRVSLRPEMDQH
jgi:hypothetical protein